MQSRNVFTFNVGNNFQHVLDKKPDKVDLLNLLVSYDDLWAEIGEGLKVDGRHIRGLRQTSGMSNKIKLSTILQSWMDTLCSEVTWDNVKQALEGPVVDAKAIAVKISKCCVCVCVCVKVVASLVVKIGIL